MSEAARRAAEKIVRLQGQSFPGTTSVAAIVDGEFAALQAKLTQAQERVAELTDWMKTANGFAWAHERTCPRHDGDAPCNCGLDQFLARPRPTIESFKARLKLLEDTGKALGSAAPRTNDYCNYCLRRIGYGHYEDCKWQAFTEALNAKGGANHGE